MFRVRVLSQHRLSCWLVDEPVEWRDCRFFFLAGEELCHLSYRQLTPVTNKSVLSTKIGIVFYVLTTD